jgi:hypothetical protein
MSKKRRKKISQIKKHLGKTLPIWVSWCILGIVTSCSFYSAGSAVAALGRAGNNYARQASEQPVIHSPSPSVQLMRRHQSAPSCNQAASGTACSLNLGRQPSGLPNSENNSRQQVGAPQFKLMKKNAGQLNKIITSIKSQIAALQKQNINLPPELIQALSTLNGDIGQIKNATSSDSIQGMNYELMPAMQTIREWSPKLSPLTQLPKLMKQAQAQLDQALKTYTNDQKRAANSKFDITQPLADYKAIVDQLQSALDQEKTIIQTDPATATTSLQTNFFDKLNTLQGKKLILDIALSPKIGLAEANQIISQDQKQINSLKKNGTDITQLTAQITQAKSQAKQVKISLASSSISVADTMLDIQSLASILQSLSDSLPAPKIFTPNKPGANFQPPPGFTMNPGELQPNQIPQPDQNPPGNTPSVNQILPSPPLPAPDQGPTPDQNNSTGTPASGQDTPPPPPAAIQ